MLVKDSTLFFRVWVGACQLLTRVFYRRLEIVGENQRHSQGGIIYCANHVNALVDPAIVQATTGHVLRPLARSGLFDSFYLPMLRLIGAIPIYRATDKGVDPSQNKSTFRKVFELLEKNEKIVIFPEGQSHSDPHVNALKTGAARIAMGALEQNTHAPLIVPVGLNFSQKGHFRSDVLVNYGEAIDLAPYAKQTAPGKASINALTQQIEAGMKNVTLNTQSWQQMRLVRLLERFFAMRRGKHKAATFGERFKGMQRIIKAHDILHERAPEQLQSLLAQLRLFERVCNTLGVRNYHLDIEYGPAVIVRFAFKALVMLIIGLPIAAIGFVHGLIPHFLSEYFVNRFARGTDQIDTARILFSLLFFGLFWSLQIAWVYIKFGLLWAIGAAIVIVLLASITLFFRKEIAAMVGNARVFLMFLRKRQLRQYIIHKRDELIVELAKMVRLANRLMREKGRSGG